MTERDTNWPAGTPCWVDLMTTDAEKGRAFYEALFGWKFAVGTDEAGGYFLAEVDGRPVAGFGSAEPGRDPAWVTYLATDDVPATAAAITAAGGTLVMPPTDVYDFGVMAMALDSTGGAFGLWQGRTHIGARLANTASSLVWNELITPDHSAAADFYGAAFGYSFTDMSAEGFVYSTIDVDGRAVGGIGQLPADLPRDVPPHWRVYFGVPDTDAAADSVQRLGGRVHQPPSDSPYGRMAEVSDPQGARFWVITAPAEA